MKHSKVALVKTDENLFDWVSRAISLIGGLDKREYDKVVIKPNLCSYDTPDSGITTDVRIVKAIMEYITKNLDVNEMLIVESDGSRVRADISLKMLGYEKVAKEYNAKTVNLSKDQLVEINTCGLFFKKLKLPITIMDCDLFVSVPKLKIFMLDGMTCALKNQFGCNPDPNKDKYHAFLSKVIVDLNTVMRPDLCLVDGIIGLEGRGPARGTPVRMNLIICGSDPVAVDTVVAKVMGLDPYRIRHLRLAAKRGLGSMENIEIVGENVESVCRRFKVIPRYESFIRRLLLTI